MHRASVEVELATPVCTYVLCLGRRDPPVSLWSLGEAQSHSWEPPGALARASAAVWNALFAYPCILPPQTHPCLYIILNV